MVTNRIKKILIAFEVVAIIGGLALSYYGYNQACNNSQVYTGVAVVYSKDVYKFCGNRFAIINRSQEPINVETRTISSTEDDQDVVETSTLQQTTTLNSGEGLPIEADNTTIYVIDNKMGSNLEHTISLQKIS